jgi:pyruvate dehydrogenase E2 component (dihydrolipoamide acetyltransferase)
LSIEVHVCKKDLKACIMVTPVVMPKQGNSVETCLILRWYSSIRDQISEGDLLCEVETDKAIVEIASPSFGILLDIFFSAGEEVPVFTNIAAIGKPGEDASNLKPEHGSEKTIQESVVYEATDSAQNLNVEQAIPQGEADETSKEFAEPGPLRLPISPRARKLATKKRIDISGIHGSGPAGRVLEHDVQEAIEKRTLISPLAESMPDEGNYFAPGVGTGIRGRIMSNDLLPSSNQIGEVSSDQSAPGIEKTIPLQGARRLIAERMVASLQATAQLTLNTSANAEPLIAFRNKLKNSTAEWGLQEVIINDLILFVVSRVLMDHHDLNAIFEKETIYQFQDVHLGVAVDTPQGLIVPVLREANKKSLKRIAMDSRLQAQACKDGKIDPAELNGGTFTVTNLGHLGIESFTPILNPPQVGILGVGNINLKPVEVSGEITMIPRIGLSLTINHQVVDGAPGARFLNSLTQGIAEVDLLLST